MGRTEKGGLLKNPGFTFVELLVTMAVIGILASLALPQLQGFRRRSMVSTMQADLRTFAMHQESHFYDTSTYTDDLVVLRAKGFQNSPEVSVTVNEATFLGWAATMKHAQLLIECYMFIGNAAPVGTAVAEGQIACS